MDVGAFRDDSGGAGGTATATRTVWTPAALPLILPAAFPPSASVQVLATEGGQTLVAAIELVSPGNKDRAVKRRLIAAKCAAHLARGVGLVIVDVVTSRRANLGNELLALLDVGTDRMPDDALYAVGYRPLREQGAERIDCWPVPLEIGQPLPTMPLSLHADCCLPLDLETAYMEACQRRRLDEVIE